RPASRSSRPASRASCPREVAPSAAPARTSRPPRATFARTAASRNTRTRAKDAWRPDLIRWRVAAQDGAPPKTQGHTSVFCSPGSLDQTLATGVRLAEPRGMRRVLVLCLLIPGCDLYWGHGTDDDQCGDDIYNPPATLLRDPDTGTCASSGGGSCPCGAY